MLNALNIMGLRTPQSAILSAVIFNALIIIALIPLALKGVKYRPMSAAALLRRNLLIYGLGGIVVPFIGIKIIDVVIHVMGWLRDRIDDLSGFHDKAVTVALQGEDEEEFSNSSFDDDRDDDLARARLSAGRDWTRASDLSRSSKRAADQER